MLKKQLIILTALVLIFISGSIVQAGQSILLVVTGPEKNNHKIEYCLKRELMKSPGVTIVTEGKSDWVVQVMALKDKVGMIYSVIFLRPFDNTQLIRFIKPKIEPITDSEKLFGVSPFMKDPVKYVNWITADLYSIADHYLYARSANDYPEICRTIATALEEKHLKPAREMEIIFLKNILKAREELQEWSKKNTLQELLKEK